MKNPQEITNKTVYDFAKDIDNGFITTGEDMFIDYQSPVSRPESILLESGKLKYLMQHLLNSWLNLHTYLNEEKKSFEIDINWNEYNKLLSLDTSFLALTNSDNGYDIYTENLKEYIIKLPNAVIFSIIEY